MREFVSTLIQGALILLALFVLLLLTGCAARTSPQTAPAAPHVHTTGEGMSPWMAGLMFGGQAGDLITTEINHARGLHESNVLMASRYVRYPVKILGPLATFYSVRHLPRGKANLKALGWTITGLGMTGVNITILKVWGD